MTRRTLLLFLVVLTMPASAHDAVQQEMHNPVDLQCRDALMRQQGKGAKEIQQEDFMNKAFRGS